MTLIFVGILAVLAFALFFAALRSRRRHALERGIQPLDVVSFQTLSSRDEEEFFREKLPRRNFSRMKRMRIRVTWGYVNRISDNASVVLRAADIARHETDANVVLTAAELADLATQIRMQCLLAMTKLAAEYAFPSLQLAPAKLAPAYESLQQTLARLRALHPENVPQFVSA